MSNTSATATTTPSNSAREIPMLIVGLALPSVITWLYFVALAGSSAMQAAYTVGKGAQFLLPVVWILLVCRQRPQLARPTGRGVLAGVVFGAVVGGAMLAVYGGWMAGNPLFASLTESAREKIAQFGTNTPLRFMLLGAFYACIHSLLEEYYWRWFVFGACRRVMPSGPAILVSSLGFMAHHVIVLCVLLPDNIPLALVASAGVAIGGAFWAWLYERSDSLYGPWISHALVDAAIMAAGYQILFS